MNRAERRAAEKHAKNMQSSTTIRKSYDGIYAWLGVVGCLLSLVWVYTSNSKLPYLFAVLMFIHALNFGMRVYQRKTGK